MILNRRLMLAISMLLAIFMLSGCATPSSSSGESSSALSRNDLLTVNKIYEAIQSNPNLRDQTIFVKSIKGVVTLTGVAESSIERTLAARVAAAVDGVESVNNKLTVP